MNLRKNYSNKQRLYSTTTKINKDICNERPDPGPCDQWQTKYYYDTDTRRCQPFTYGGCDGSANRFNSQSECESLCGAPQPPVEQQPMDIQGI